MVAAALLLIPAASASAANFPLTLDPNEGSGTGTIECEVESGPVEACAAEYAGGTEIAFVAEPAVGSEFYEWGGDCVGQGGDCELTIEEATLVSAVFELEEVPLETETEGPGVGEIECEVELGPAEECATEYPYGTKIAFVGVPDKGSEFVEWEGDCTGSGACELTMDKEHFVAAVFDESHFALKIEFKGNGEGAVECEVEGGSAEECKPTYLEGTEVALVAEPETNSEFVKWEGDCTGSGACELTMGEEHSVTAIFALEEFALELETGGEGEGQIECEVEGGSAEECEVEYPFGTKVALVAAPSLGSEFVEWEGDCSGSGACELTMDKEHSVTAIFAVEPPPSEFVLTVSLAGTGSGTVTSSPGIVNCGVICSDVFTAGKEVTLTATPASGSTFGGWSGACTGTGACKVTMSQARSVTATFEKEPTPPPGIAKVASTAKVKGGKALLKLTCTGEGPCKGTLKLTAKIKSGGKTKTLTIGKASFSLGAGTGKTVKVKLSGPAKKAVATKPLKAKVKGSGVRSSTVKLKK
jgi:hypothetical protein